MLNSADLEVIRVHVLVPIVKTIVRDFTLYMIGNPLYPPEHELAGQQMYTAAQRNWAKEIAKNPSQIADQVSHFALNLDGFKNEGSSVNFGVLQGHLENAIKNHFFPV